MGQVLWHLELTVLNGSTSKRQVDVKEANGKQLSTCEEDNQISPFSLYHIVTSSAYHVLLIFVPSQEWQKENQHLSYAASSQTPADVTNGTQNSFWLSLYVTQNPTPQCSKQSQTGRKLVCLAILHVVLPLIY